MDSIPSKKARHARRLIGAIALAGTISIPGVHVAADTPVPVTTLPGDPISVFTRMYQREADEAFQGGDYERAHRIYLDKLVQKGDKHAQYMLGVLNERGLGIPQDKARALAWYALASERGSGDTKAKALALKASLSIEDQQRADAILMDLHGRFGDQRLMVKAIRRDYRELKRRTGTLIPGAEGSSPSRVFAVDGTSVESNDFYNRLEQRIDLRLQLLGGNVSLRELVLIDEQDSTEADDTAETEAVEETETP